MIEIRNLSKEFGKFQALKNLNITVNKGEIYGFIGKNGAGKSTTMNIITGLSKQTSGTCIVNNLDVSSINHPRDLNIGYLPENPEFQGWLTAYETLQFLVTDVMTDSKKEEIITLLEWVGLNDSIHRRVGGFSRGMKQRLGMACALINNPELVILDEPSSALDPQGRADVLALIQDLKQRGKTIIFSTHILSDVERVCDRVGILYDGELILEKNLVDLMNQTNKPIVDVVLEHDYTSKQLDTIKKFPEVLKINVNHYTVSVYVSDKKYISQTMKKCLDVFGDVKSVQVRKNTLEDLFIKEVNGK